MHGHIPFTCVDYEYEELLEMETRGLLLVDEDTGEWLLAYTVVFPLGSTLDQLSADSRSTP